MLEQTTKFDFIKGNLLMKSTRKPLSMTALFLAVSALLVLSACGGGGSSSGAVKVLFDRNNSSHR